MLTVDTRFFLTHFLAISEEMKNRTRNKMIELQREGAIVPTMVIHEVYKFECENVGKDVAELRVGTILKSGFTIMELSSQIAIVSGRLRCKYHNIPTADSIIAATATETKSRRVLSDDPHFTKIMEIKTEWI